MSMDGILVIDKPGGFTSTQVVGIVKKLLKTKKAGHIGTLDPLATGVLPVCLNKATKVIPYLDDSCKEYVAKMQLGLTTDTQDRTGKLVDMKNVGKIARSDILKVFKNFTGEIEQIPPMYSALKQNGVRLYELARKGVEVKRKRRTVIVKELELIEFRKPVVTLRVKCSRGTYVRVLCSDIGDSLGTGATLNELRRIGSSGFNISDSFKITDVEKGNFKLIGLDQSLQHLRAFEISEDLAQDVRNGKSVSKSMLRNTCCEGFSKGENIRLMCRNELVSVVESLLSYEEIDNSDMSHQVFKIKRVFN